MIQGRFSVNMVMAVSMCKNLQLTAIAVQSRGFLKLPFWVCHARSIGLCVDVPNFVMGVENGPSFWLPKASLFLGN